MSLLAMCQPNILYGGPGGSRTRVQNAFTLKGLQQFFTYASWRRDLPLFLTTLDVAAFCLLKSDLLYVG